MPHTLVVAEAGVNHNGDVGIAKELIAVAAEAGADYVKFQTFKADQVVTIGAKQAQYQITEIGTERTQLQMLRRLELRRDSHDVLIDYARHCGTKFLSTAFDIDSLLFLDGLGVDIVKIPSGEITNYPYLQTVASLNKRIILSTGMSSIGDVEAALMVLTNSGAEMSSITVLHCTTAYPAPIAEVNLNVIRTLRAAFGVAVGYSDHTMGIAVPIAAVALGASVIEKHFTLDRNMIGPDHLASLESDDLKLMISSIRLTEQALGDGVKRVTSSEKENALIARKSLVAKCAIKKGEKFSEDNICVKRPGTGISPMCYYDVIGRSASRNFRFDDLIEI